MLFYFQVLEKLSSGKCEPDTETDYQHLAVCYSLFMITKTSIVKTTRLNRTDLSNHNIGCILSFEINIIH